MAVLRSTAPTAQRQSTYPLFHPVPGPYAYPRLPIHRRGHGALVMHRWCRARVETGPSSKAPVLQGSAARGPRLTREPFAHHRRLDPLPAWWHPHTNPDLLTEEWYFVLLYGSHVPSDETFFLSPRPCVLVFSGALRSTSIPDAVHHTRQSISCLSTRRLPRKHLSFVALPPLSTPPRTLPSRSLFRGPFLLLQLCCDIFHPLVQPVPQRI
jgi:hypothetical protein